MRTLDFSPLFRSGIGFDNINRALDAARRLDETSSSYPPYNIESHGEDSYRISMAVAGFAQDDLDITVKERALVVSGKIADTKGDDTVTYLHKGIAGRTFERRFELAEHVQVQDASLENGLLHIKLVREIPEEKKPRKVTIGQVSAPTSLEDKTAA